MELESRDFRAMIFYDFKRGLSVTDCSDQLSATFGESAPSKPTVYKWYREFSLGRKSIKVDPSPGRPVSVTTQENVEAVRKLVDRDRRITYDEIQEELGLSSTTIHKILHEHLKLRKVCARWVPHMLTENQKRARVEFCETMLREYDRGRSKSVYSIMTGDETWVYNYNPESKRQSMCWVGAGDAPPIKFKRIQSTGKVMVEVFFGKCGHISTIPVEEQRTVTALWYVTNCLPKALHEWGQQHPRTGTRGLKLHHDNASAHKAHVTLEFLEREKVKSLPHPPYSPDLAPCDFFLFLLSKTK